MSDRLVVVIPAFNAAAFILDALASVGPVEGVHLRVVVVDDGSTDRTAEVVREWIPTALIPTTLIQQPNQGISVARNTGILASDEPLIAFLDADDVFLPGHLERLIRALSACPEALVAFDDAHQFSSAGIMPITMLERAAGLIDTIASTPVPGTDFRSLGEGLFQSLLSGNWIAPSTWLLHRRALAVSGLFSAAQVMIEDRDLALRLALDGPFVQAPGVGVGKRVHDTNITRPENAELFNRYALLALATIRLRSAPRHQPSIDSAIDATAQEYWYQASMHGRRHLAECAAWVRSLGLKMRPGARDVARATMRVPT